MNHITNLNKVTTDIIDKNFKNLTKGSHFLFVTETGLLQILLESLAETIYTIEQFEKVLSEFLTKRKSEYQEFIEQLNPTNLNDRDVIELHSIELSVNFKSFIILSKASLDKLIPLYHYRFVNGPKEFHKKGRDLLKNIECNRNVLEKKALAKLIIDAKSDWIDNLIDLRDNYVHTSRLEEYKNFSLIIDNKIENDISFEGFQSPTIKINDKKSDALNYMLDTKIKLISFTSDFIKLCDFNSVRAPRSFLACEYCREPFAKLNKKIFPRELEIVSELTIIVKDRARDYGVVVCPSCKEETEILLSFWKKFGHII